MSVQAAILEISHKDNQTSLQSLQNDLESFHKQTLDTLQDLSNQMAGNQRKTTKQVIEIVGYNMHHLTIILGFCTFALVSLLAINSVILYVLLLRKSNCDHNAILLK